MKDSFPLSVVCLFSHCSFQGSLFASKRLVFAWQVATHARLRHRKNTCDLRCLEKEIKSSWQIEAVQQRIVSSSTHHNKCTVCPVRTIHCLSSCFLPLTCWLTFGRTNQLLTLQVILQSFIASCRYFHLPLD